jgi:hypothetical protein
VRLRMNGSPREPTDTALATDDLSYDLVAANLPPSDTRTESCSRKYVLRIVGTDAPSPNMPTSW